MEKLILYMTIILAVVTLSVCGKSVITDTGTEISSSDKTIPNTSGSDIVPENDTKENGVKDSAGHSGIFSFKMSGYKGELAIEVRDEKFYGTIKFFNWGNGVPQPLNDLKITENKIYFKRVINTREDLIKYGGTAFFEQDFYGIFSQDRKKIKGYYRYAGTQDGWEAVKK